MMENRGTLVFYSSWREALADYPPELRLEVYEAVFTYAFTGEVADMSQLAGMAFSFIKMQIESNTDKFDRKCEGRRKAANRRWSRHPEDEIREAAQKDEIREAAQKDEIREAAQKDEIREAEPVTAPGIHSDIAGKSLDDCKKELQSDRAWRESMLMAVHSCGWKKVTDDDVGVWLERFFIEKSAEGIQSKLPADCKRHFYSWLRLQLKNCYNGDNRGNNESGGGGIGALESIEF